MPNEPGIFKGSNPDKPGSPNWPLEHSQLFHQALKAKGVDSELLELPTGEHGLGCGVGPLWKAWQDRCLEWMSARKLLERK